MVARRRVELVDEPDEVFPVEPVARRSRTARASPPSTARRACCSMSRADAPPVMPSISQRGLSPSRNATSIARSGASRKKRAESVDVARLEPGAFERRPSCLREQPVRGETSAGMPAVRRLPGAHDERLAHAVTSPACCPQLGRATPVGPHTRVQYPPPGRAGDSSGKAPRASRPSSPSTEEERALRPGQPGSRLLLETELRVSTRARPFPKGAPHRLPASTARRFVRWHS